jgi:hypothetical protein
MMDDMERKIEKVLRKWNMATVYAIREQGKISADDEMERFGIIE